MKYSKELHDKLRNRTGLHIFNHQIGLDSEDIDTLLDEIERLKNENKQYQNIFDLQKATIERLQAERRWIPVSERLPEIGFTGLCQVAGNGYVIARYAPYDSEGGWTSDEIGYCFVTHWMPLPPPPELPRDK